MIMNHHDIYNQQWSTTATTHLCFSKQVLKAREARALATTQRDVQISNQPSVEAHMPHQSGHPELAYKMLDDTYIVHSMSNFSRKTWNMMITHEMEFGSQIWLTISNNPGSSKMIQHNFLDLCQVAIHARSWWCNNCCLGGSQWQVSMKSSNGICPSLWNDTIWTSAELDFSKNGVALTIVSITMPLMTIWQNIFFLGAYS